MNMTSRILGESEPTEIDVLKAYVLIWEKFEAAGFWINLHLLYGGGPKDDDDDGDARSYNITSLDTLKKFLRDREIEDYVTLEPSWYRGTFTVTNLSMPPAERIELFKQVAQTLCRTAFHGQRPLNRPLGEVYVGLRTCLAFAYVHTVQCSTGCAGKVTLV